MQDGKFLTFELAEQLYAIDICRIKEILNGCGRISTVPEFPEYGKGVINLRGDIVPIIDMRTRFHLPQAQRTGKECIIVTEAGNALESDYLGFAVDKVDAVADFDGSQVSPPPKMSGANSKYVMGVYKAEDRIIMIIDPDELVTETMKNAIGSYMSNNT